MQNFTFAKKSVKNCMIAKLDEKKNLLLNDHNEINQFLINTFLGEIKLFFNMRPTVYER